MSIPSSVAEFEKIYSQQDLDWVRLTGTPKV